MANVKQTIGVIGGGAWGTALAHTLSLNGNDVLLWAREKEVLKNINKNHENKRFLPGITLSPNIKATADLESIPQKCNIIFAANPAFATTEIAANISPYITSLHTIIICSKGLRASDGALLSQVWQEAIKDLRNVAALGGPAFAMEMAQGKPSALILACKTKDVTLEMSDLFVDSIKLYFSDDIIGVQIGGALKNVIAIAAGISDALDLGKNARAAVICRSLLEVQRYAVSIGAKPETITGLAGLGDILLSATSELSMNYRFGRHIAQHVPLNRALDMFSGEVEGVRTARIVTSLANSRGIDLSVIAAVDGIINGDIQPENAIKLLMERPRTWEFNG